MPSKRPTLVGAVLAATLVVAGSGSAYGHEPLEPVAGVTGVPASSAAAQQITLITGDVVTVTNVGASRRSR